MGRNRLDEADYRAVAEETGIDAADVRRSVVSFFSYIAYAAGRLPFDNPRKIYSRKAFDEVTEGMTVNIPGIGRIGPSYSRYLRWRANASHDVEQVPRGSYYRGLSRQDIENLAEHLLKGKEMPKVERNSFRKVWLVGADGRKRQARQVMPKHDKTE